MGVHPADRAHLAALYALGLANVLVAADSRAPRVRLQLEVQTVVSISRSHPAEARLDRLGSHRP